MQIVGRVYIHKPGNLIDRVNNVGRTGTRTVSLGSRFWLIGDCRQLDWHQLGMRSRACNVQIVRCGSIELVIWEREKVMIIGLSVDYCAWSLTVWFRVMADRLADWLFSQLHSLQRREVREALKRKCKLATRMRAEQCVEQSYSVNTHAHTQSPTQSRTN